MTTQVNRCIENLRRVEAIKGCVLDQDDTLADLIGARSYKPHPEAGYTTDNLLLSLTVECLAMREETIYDVPGSSTFSGSSVFSGVGSPGLPGRDEHWLVRVIELVLDVPRKRDEEARRSPVVAFQSNNPKVMRLQIERLGCCSSRWGARMSLGRALRAFWYCCSISRSICVSRFIDGGVSALSSRPVVMDLNQPASFCAGSTW